MVKVTGSREVQEKLDKLKNLGSRISFEEVFTPTFISTHSRYASMSELIDASGFNVESEADIKAIPDEDWERHIVDSTNFRSWAEMQKIAGGEFIKRTLEQ